MLNFDVADAWFCGSHVNYDLIPYLPFFICQPPTYSLGKQEPCGRSPAPQASPSSEALQPRAHGLVSYCLLYFLWLVLFLCLSRASWRQRHITPVFISPIWGCRAAAAGPGLTSSNLVLAHLQTSPVSIQVFLEGQKHLRMNVSGMAIMGVGVAGTC